MVAERKPIGSGAAPAAAALAVTEVKYMTRVATDTQCHWAGTRKSKSQQLHISRAAKSIKEDIGVSASWQLATDGRSTISQGVGKFREVLELQCMWWIDTGVKETSAGN